MAKLSLTFHRLRQSQQQLYNILKIWPWKPLWWIALALVFGVTLYALSFPGSNLGPVTVTDTKNNSAIHGMMPFYINSPSTDGDYKFAFTFTKEARHPDEYIIAASDCLRELTINDKPVDLGIVPPESLCQHPEGFGIDLSSYLHAGENTITAQVKNLYDDHYGLSFAPYYPWMYGPWLFGTLFAASLLLMLGRWVFDPAFRANPVWIVVCMVAFACALRWPFFFQSVSVSGGKIFTNWDESTYFNMGKYVLAGNLPYDTLWDNKPPLLFYIFGLLIDIAHGDIAIVRLLGAIIIGITGALLLALVTKLHNRTAGWYAGLFYILFCSVNAWTYSVLSDHLAIPLIVLAFWLFLAAKPPYGRYSITIGLLIGIAAMIQTNYWFLAFAFALMQCMWFLPLSRKNAAAIILYGAALGAASALPFLFFWNLYALHDMSELFWRSVVTAELGHERMHLENGLLDIIGDKYNMTLKLWMERMGSSMFLPSALFFMALMNWFTPAFHMPKRNKIALSVFVVFSLFTAGARTSHILLPPQYLGLMLPICICSAIFLSNFLNRRNILAIVILLFGVHLALQPTYSVYDTVFSRLGEKLPLKDDTMYEIAATINNTPMPHPYIFACEAEQILYYLTDSGFPTLIAHPHILKWGFLPNTAYNRHMSLRNLYDVIKSHNPAYIISPANYYCLDEFGGDYMKNYHLLYSIDKQQLWQRNEDAPQP